jgi:hypothetical protein
MHKNIFSFLGKCSNASYATRQAIEVLKSLNKFPLDQCTFTTCDTDNIFPVDYMQTLERAYLEDDDRHEVKPVFKI